MQPYKAMEKEYIKQIRRLIIIALCGSLFCCAQPINWTGIAKLNSINIAPAKVSVQHQKINLTAHLNVIVANQLNDYSDKLLKTKITESLSNSLAQTGIFSKIDTENSSMADLTISVKYSFSHSAYGDLEFFPFAAATLFIITPSHVVTNCIAEMHINSPYPNLSCTKSFNESGTGWTMTGITGQGDAAAWAIEDTLSKLNNVMTEFISSKYSAFEEFANAKGKSNVPVPSSGNSEARLNNSPKPKGYGTGFFIGANGLIATCAHVAKDATAIKIKTSDGLFSAKVLKSDPINDIAILKAVNITGNEYLSVASSNNTQLGESVFTIGFPNPTIQGYEPKYTSGEISSLAGVQDDQREFQISIPIQPGNSGSPLVDMHGNVIGIVAASLKADVAFKSSGALPQNVNYAVKSAYLLALLGGIPEFQPIPQKHNTNSEEAKKRAEKASFMIVVY